MKVSEFIQEATEELEAGWVKHSYANDQGVCVLGALDRVALRHVSDGSIPARAVAQQEIQKKAAEMFPALFRGSIPSLNDNSTIDKRDMLALLEKTAIGLDEVGR